ncbi:MAG: cysteine desulfurase family protein [Ilumatobacteraceae bacterium]
MTSSVGRLAYLDHAATTPMRESAIAAMAPYLAEHYANPSGSHRFSRMARTAIDEARDDVADVLGCAPGEVVFTSGGTEGDNAAVFGAVRRHGGVAVCSAVEHHAVLHCVEHLHGEVVVADRFGLIDLAALKQTLERVAQRGERVAVVSVMAVNNEVGTITPIRDVARVVRGSAEHAVFHSDAVQAACWLDVRDIVAVTDVVSFSAHKFGGPKGMGVMVVKKGVTLEPLIMGGGQERDRRSGTSNVAGIVATAAALRETVTTREAEVVRVAELKRLLIEGICSQLPDVLETVPGVGTTETRPSARNIASTVPGVAHLCFADVESEALLFLLDEAGVCASAASACASGAMEPSHVLRAMGVPSRFAKGALRLSLGHTTTSDDVAHAVTTVVASVRRLRTTQ